CLGGPVGAEDSVSGGTSGMDDAFGDPLVVEMGDLLPQMMVLQEHRTALPGLKGIVRIAQPPALSRGVVFALLALARSVVVAQRACRGRRPGPALVRFRLWRRLRSLGLVDVRRLCRGLARNCRKFG